MTLPPIFPHLVLVPGFLQATVEQEVAGDRLGKVNYEGTSWTAKLFDRESQETLNPSQAVWVMGVEGETLLIVAN